MVRMAVIGCGYWGPNLIRNITKVKDCRLVAIADQRPERLESVKHLNSEMKPTTVTSEVIESDSIDAVVIATPISTPSPITPASGSSIFSNRRGNVRRLKRAGSSLPFTSLHSSGHDAGAPGSGRSE